MKDDGPVSTKRLRLTLSWRVSFLVAGLLVVSAIASTAFAVRTTQAELFVQSEEAAGNVHASVAALIQAEYEGIAIYREEALQRRKESLKDVAAPLVVSLDELRMAADTGQITLEHAQERALAILKSVRFGEDDYFFTYDRDLNAIAHPDARFQGRNLTDLQDADGKYVLREMRDVALMQGSGFVDYRWERLDGVEPAAKVGYVFHYAPWDWIIGTGVYVDDIDAEVRKQVAKVTAGLQQTFDHITFADDGFFCILDREGRVVATGDPRFRASATTVEGQADIAVILKAAPSKPGVENEATTDAAWATDSDEVWLLRISATGADPDWVLVSAVPERRLEAPGGALALHLILLAVVILLIGLALGLLISRRITRPVDDITRAARDLSDGAFDPSSLDAAASRSDEVGGLARAVQRMGLEIVERERRLREVVESLTVQIDRAKVAEEVQGITETDYFQRLKSRSEELRRRDQ